MTIHSHENLQNRALRFFGGLKFSFALLTVMALLAAQKAVLSQLSLQENAPDFLRPLTEQQGIPSAILGFVVAVVLVLFVINLMLSARRMLRKVQAKRRTFSLTRDRGAIEALPNSAAFSTATDCAEPVAAWFRGRGYRVETEREGDTVLIHVGRRLGGVWGVFLFHLAFMVLLPGILLSMLTGFAGYVALSPGDVFVEKHSAYMRAMERPPLFGSDRLFRIRLDDFSVSYWQPGQVKDRSSTVSLFAPDGTFIRQQRLEINQPASVGRTDVYQGTRQGFAADLVVSDAKGTSVKATARFLFPAKAGEGLTCALHLPGTEMTLLMELVTDQVRSVSGLESLAPAHPATLIKLKTVEHGPPVFRGVLFPGTGLRFEGLQVGFVKLKPFSSLVIKRDYGVPLIFASFVPLLLALVVSYYWVPENWWIVVQRNGEDFSVTAGATVERYGESFRERFAEMVAELREKVSAR